MWGCLGLDLCLTSGLFVFLEESIDIFVLQVSKKNSDCLFANGFFCRDARFDWSKGGIIEIDIDGYSNNSNSS